MLEGTCEEFGKFVDVEEVDVDVVDVVEVDVVEVEEVGEGEGEAASCIGT